MCGYEKRKRTIVFKLLVNIMYNLQKFYILQKMLYKLVFGKKTKKKKKEREREREREREKEKKREREREKKKEREREKE